MRYGFRDKDLVVYFTPPEINAVLHRVNGTPTAFPEADLGDLFDWSVTDLVYRCIHDHVNRKTGDPVEPGFLQRELEEGIWDGLVMIDTKQALYPLMQRGSPSSSGGARARRRSPRGQRGSARD